MAQTDHLDWEATLAALTEFALQPVMVLVLPPVAPSDRVPGGLGSVVILTGRLGRMQDKASATLGPQTRRILSDDTLLFPVGTVDGLSGFFGISRAAFSQATWEGEGERRALWIRLTRQTLRIMPTAA